MNTPPPPTEKSQKVKFWTRAIWFSGCLIIIPPMVGLLGTVKGMLGAFSDLSKHGGADPDMLADDIAVAMNTTSIGLGLSVIGIICLILSILKLKAAKASR